MVILIDADFLCYRNTAACQYTTYTLEEEGNEFATFVKGKKATDAFLKENSTYAVTGSEEVLESWEQCKSSIDSSIAHILGACDAGSDSDIFFLISGKDNFRYTLSPTYKISRRDTPKPHWHNKAHQYLIDAYAANESHGMESDDRVAMGVQWCQENGLDYIIVHMDKDLDQLEGKHYNPVDHKHYTITKKQAILNLYSQILSGDSTDDIDGIKGVGKVKAENALHGCTGASSCLQVAREMYKKAYGEEGEGKLRLCTQLVYLKRSAGDTIFNRREWLESKPTEEVSHGKENTTQ